MNFDQLLNSAVYDDLLQLGKNPSFMEEILHLPSKEENFCDNFLTTEFKSSR